MPIFLLFIALVLGYLGSQMAKKRGRDPVGWFILCFFFPLIGLVILAAVGDALKPQERPQYRERDDGPRYLPEASAPAQKPAFDKAKWDALAEFDPDVRAAVEKLGPYGSAAVKRFSVAYMALQDKAMIGSIVERIIEQSGRPASSPEEAKAAFLANTGWLDEAKRRELLRTSEAIVEKIRRDGMSLYDEAVASCEVYFGPIEEFHGQALVEYQNGKREFWNGGVASPAPEDA